MPELPEVETVRRGLERFLSGKAIRRVELFCRRLRRDVPEDLAEQLTGQRVGSIRRRGKFLLCELSNESCLVVHLGMTGSFTFFSSQLDSPWTAASITKHDHLILHLADEEAVVYNDPRRFGIIDIVPLSKLADYPWLASLGIEPLGNALSGRYLHDRFKGKSAPVKNVLLDQRIVAGLGNIYASEALWLAGISPKRKARQISIKRLGKLADTIRQVLHDAIRSGGSSLRNYRSVTGSMGYFQHQFKVYERTEAPCPKPECDGMIKRIVQSGRSTYYCMRCQK